MNETENKDGPWYLEQTTGLGLYPHGRSPGGVEDLSGTVWEWCVNKHEDPEVTAADSSDDVRALRGGSRDDCPVGARAGYRGRDLPDDRDGGVGFRVVSVVPMLVR